MKIQKRKSFTVILSNEDVHREGINLSLEKANHLEGGYTDWALPINWVLHVSMLIYIKTIISHPKDSCEWSSFCNISMIKGDRWSRRSCFNSCASNFLIARKISSSFYSINFASIKSWLDNILTLTDFRVILSVA